MQTGVASHHIIKLYFTTEVFSKCHTKSKNATTSFNNYNRYNPVQSSYFQQGQVSLDELRTSFDDPGGFVVCVCWFKCPSWHNIKHNVQFVVQYVPPGGISCPDHFPQAPHRFNLQTIRPHLPSNRPTSLSSYCQWKVYLNVLVFVFRPSAFQSLAFTCRYVCFLSPFSGLTYKMCGHWTHVES